MIAVRLAAACALACAPLSAAHAERLFGLTSLGSIVTFDSNSAAVLDSTSAITGIDPAETLLGFDFRPANRTLYTLSSAGNLYTLAGNSNGYLATLVGTVAVTIAGGYGLDFNPVADRLRAVSALDQNTRIVPGSAAATSDLAVNYPGNPSLDPNILGIAYSNSRVGTVSTIEYGIDSRTDSLVRFLSPNAGTLQTVGALGIAIADTDRVSFDISGRLGDAFMARNDRLYAVNLATGRATNLGRIGGLAGPQIIGLTATAVPEPASWALMIGGFGVVGGSLRRRRREAVA